VDGQWAYLAVFMDLWSRVIVGWYVDDNMEEKLVIRAFYKGLARRQLKPGLILHTDGGSQYGSIAFRKVLKANECEQSMTRKDNHYDNAFSESLFSRFKAEVLEGGKFLNLEDASAECFEYIDAYYNTQRKHSSLGNKNPLQFESEMGN
jgi:transposase InsO family protein